MMRICIDMRPALSRATGVGVYLLNVVEALAELDQENEYHLFSSSWKERFRVDNYGKNFQIHDQRLPVKLLNHVWHHFSWPPIERLLRLPLDVVHSPSPLVIPSRTARKVTMIHDLYFYFHPEDTVREIKKDYPALLRKHCMQSDAIIAVSEYTKQQLVEHFQVPASKVYTIRHGVDLFFSESVPREDRMAVRKKYGIHGPYFLFVGAPEPRKNLEVLLESFRNFPEEAELVLAGPGKMNENCRQLMTQHVIQTDYVSREDLRALYQDAVALVMPSKEEGFGLPLLEAMAAGTPILASGIPAFYEVAGDCFLAVDSSGAEELKEGMRQMYSDSGLRKKLVEKGKERLKKFSWQEAAQKTLDIYRNL